MQIINETDWLIIGGGASGLAVAEIFARSGKNVILIEKNNKLAAETSGLFHEWLHTGSLYSLVPDRLRTVKYLLGAIDDLFEYYSCFENMNLIPSENGFHVNAGDRGWFNEDSMYYRYRNRPFNPVWNSISSRAIFVNELIRKHDWLRRRAGSLFMNYSAPLQSYLLNYGFDNKKFNIVKSPDVTMRSDVLLSDIAQSMISHGGKLILNCELTSIEEKSDYVYALTSKGMIKAKNIILCSSDGNSRFINATVKISYAPMFVVDGVDPIETSFVELDYDQKKCINLIKKGGGIGLAGGASVSTKAEIEPYLNYCIDQHVSRNPKLKVLGSYVGLKKELGIPGANRNYLYHITESSPRVTSVILGKFTLLFSLAPELFRRKFGVNPPRHLSLARPGSTSIDATDLIAQRLWQKILQQRSM